MQNDYYSSHNVLLVTFGDDPANDKNAYLALTQLKELDSQHQIKLSDAAVVLRVSDGRIETKAEVGDPSYEATAAGGLIGLLIGILGGPIGMLLGGTTGLLTGTLFDVDKDETTATVIGDMSEQVPAGRTALLAQVVEPSREVIDVAMSSLGGSVMRRSVIEVEDELAAAREAERAAKREARKQLLQAHIAQHREAAHARVEEMKTKLSRPKAAA